ncbi:XRE family transcriptional regulator [Aquitalea aquatica]|uniref:XRE family transcriptional regulator n=1 Tax=Aquitalea aquatica TaxID=3044273 RepID=A0A838YAP7_9NEIS|nr:XRE family transcriptional regulator [Aquitalea magnusonii]MBA4707741.1 XRE family transcriptional regulator [Aquitalea magnusonii]
MTADWLEILRTAVAQRGQKPVAAELGYSRTTISLVLAGKYAGKTDAVATKVLAVLATVTCPFNGQEMTMADCRAFSSSRAPTHHPLKLTHWRTCRKCKNCSKGE